MNVLITGITGFIGSRLASRLVKDGYNVHGLVRHSSERELSRIKEVISQVHLIEGDLGTLHSVLSAVDASDPGIIFHLGALTPVRLSFDDPYPYIGTNFEGTVNLVHATLKEAPNARLIVASTGEVYGWQEGDRPIAEDALLNPASPYAVTKSAADQYVQMANRVYRLKGTVLRPINSYGRTVEGGFYTEYLISKMLAGETCFVGAPDSIRDYMFAEDHVSAYVLAAKSQKAIGQIYNVSPGNPVTNSELAKMLTVMTGFKGKIVFGSYPPGYPQRPMSQDPRYLVLDNSKISKELGWKPSHTLQEGLRLTVEMWKAKAS
ncbi:MAG TPA: GDP-mannose 4,6-dehydratase [Candidatus Sulfotelmatobacter sp.]|jgi:nucleoside-diphosphate-sugar epimerase|nr:GDP-mannose 4,6-dehydratase [Candidatus Sulfotelmatobacter sp.]